MRTSNGDVFAEFVSRPGYLELTPRGETLATVWVPPVDGTQPGCLSSEAYFAGCLRSRTVLGDYAILASGGVEIGAYCHDGVVHVRSFSNSVVELEVETSDEWNPVEPPAAAHTDCSHLMLASRLHTSTPVVRAGGCRPAESGELCQIESDTPVYETPKGAYLGKITVRERKPRGRCQFSDSPWTRVEIGVFGGLVRGYVNKPPRRIAAVGFSARGLPMRAARRGYQHYVVRREDCTQPVPLAEPGVDGFVLRGDFVMKAGRVSGELSLGEDATITTQSHDFCHERSFGEIACAAGARAAGGG